MYYHVKDFVRGLDTRRMVETTEAGALIRANNCVISRGGEIEKRRAWNLMWTLPDDTYGLFAQDQIGGLWHVFGSIDPPTMPSAKIKYHQLVHPNHHSMTAVRCVRYFLGKFFVIADFSNGDTLSFYNGERVRENPYPGIAPPAQEGDGTDAVEPNPVGGDRATVSMTINRTRLNQTSTITKIWAQQVGLSDDADVETETYYAFDGTLEILAEDTDSNIATKIADAINDYTTGAVNFNAKAVGPTLYVSFADAGADYNGWFFTIYQSTEFVFNYTPSPPIFQGGVDQVASDPASGGTIGARGAIDRYSPGLYALQHKNKMFAVGGTTGLLRYSQLNAPHAWSINFTGAGFKDFSQEGGRSEATLTSLAVFQNNLAIFAGKAVYIWFMDELDDASQQVSLVQNTGTFAPKTVTEFGNTDVFYLDQTGIRSLKSREVSGAAFASDIGHPIDDLVRDAVRSASFWIGDASGVIDPIDGRYIVGVPNPTDGTSIFFVFTYFTESKVAAWTTWAVDFLIEELHHDSARMYCRTRNELYVYGSHAANNAPDDYDDCEVDVQLPYLHAGKPATEKNLMGFDVALEGEWNVEMGCDYTDPDLLEEIGLIGETTYRQQAVAVQGYSTHVSFKLTHEAEGPARIGSLAFHYTDGEEPG